MSTGRVRWFGAAKGYGFTTNKGGEDVFLPAQTLPTGATTLRKGAKVEYSMVDGHRRPQAMDVRLIASVPDLVKIIRPKADDIAVIYEGLVKMLDIIDDTLHRYCYPSAADSKKLVTLSCAVADQFDTQDRSNL